MSDYRISDIQHHRIGQNSNLCGYASLKSIIKYYRKSLSLHHPLAWTYSPRFRIQAPIYTELIWFTPWIEKIVFFYLLQPTYSFDIFEHINILKLLASNLKLYFHKFKPKKIEGWQDSCTFVNRMNPE